MEEVAWLLVSSGPLLQTTLLFSRVQLLTVWQVMKGSCPSAAVCPQPTLAMHTQLSSCQQLTPQGFYTEPLTPNQAAILLPHLKAHGYSQRILRVHL
jgi:hypothetical protein